MSVYMLCMYVCMYAWQIWARGFLKTQGKEMKAQKAKMKGNECPKGQNETK